MNPTGSTRFQLLVCRRLLALLLMAWPALVPALWPRAASAGAREPLVRTDTGMVRGLRGSGVLEFRGIPYALPPTGERRFAPPAAQTPWPGILEARRHRSPCPQVVRYGQTDASREEDCLYLNIALPEHGGRASGRLRPVLVWIHGGAFVGGSADIYPLQHFVAAGDLVIVSINYRLGALGFMVHPALDATHAGGLGLEDQREALRWIRRNIRSFGGDPDNITLAGESAGAASVCMQLTAPRQASGLFQKAIMQSIGCPFPLRTQAEAMQTGLQLAARVHCDDAARALACLRSRPVDVLLEAQGELGAALPLAFAPAVGSISTPQQPLAALRAGEFVRVPILNGGNRDELRLYVGYEVAAGHPITREDLPGRLRALYGPKAARVAAEYPVPADAVAPAWLGRLESDYVPGFPLSNCLILETARLASRFVPVYEYEFTDAAAPAVMPDPGFEMGAVHSAELAYFFPNISFNKRIDGPEVPAGSRALAQRMIAFWSAFAHGGRPQADAAPSWPRYGAGSTVMRLDPSQTGTFDAGRVHHCAFWQALYPEVLGTPPGT